VASVEFRILGPLEVADGPRLLQLGSGRQRKLLAILLVRANEVVSTDRLIDVLWGDSPPESAAKALQGYVSQLRRLLGRDLVATEPPGYALRVPPEQIDARQFERIVSDARGTQPAERAEELRSALALWRGSALAEFADEEFARTEAARLEELRIAVTEARIEADLELGGHAEVIAELEALTAQNPLRERPRAMLMLALYRSGRQGEALDVYREGRRVLVDELGIEPGDELRELQRAILAHDPAIAPPAGAIEPSEGRRGGRRRRIAFAAGAVALAAGIAVAVAELTSAGASPVVVRLDSVAVVDAGTNKVEGDVPVGGGPSAVAFGAGAVWVANAFDQTLSRIDPKTRKVTATIGIGTDETGLAVGYRSVWVAGGNDGTLTRVDPSSNAVLTRIPLGKTTNLLTDPVFAVATGEGGVWATLGESVVRIDPAPPYRVTRRIAVSHPNGLAVGDGAVWVTTTGDRILRYDASTGLRTAEVAVPAQAIAPEVGGDQMWAIVRTNDGGRIWRLNAATAETLGTTAGKGAFPIDLSFDGRALWSANESHDATLWKIDPSTDRVVAEVKLRFQLTGVATGAGSVWVTVQRII
jgi:YVTN family beta-propeller protein